MAQRSARAARDTATLREDLVVKSRAGKEKNKQVVLVVRTIAADSCEIGQLVYDVYEGSLEQLRGIDQIAISIQQIERVTQSHAANAEEGTASAEDFASQSEAIHGAFVMLVVLVRMLVSELPLSLSHLILKKRPLFVTKKRAESNLASQP